MLNLYVSDPIMMKKLLTILAALGLCLPLLADEGMWLPSLIYQRINDMQSKGLKLSAEDIYSINQPSLKDAVVQFGGGCTGELVSAEGLLLTNHHCGYGSIQRHSSVEHDYLRDGFWAHSKEEELPNPGLTIRILERMDDVTDKVLAGYDPSMTEQQRQALVKENSDRLIAEAQAEGNGISARVDPFYYGNQYYMFVFRVFSDVRLVAAPPSSIGKFGGDTDNWMWPRHTGDFSIFRVYADKDNNPAPYSPDNVPYKPKRFFNISRAGLNEGDFTFIYGYPGSTQKYIIAEAARWISEVSDPHKIDIRTKRLDVQRKYMSQSQAVRIQYSAKNASVSNAWKKWQGESLGIKRMKAVEEKLAYEKRFREWSVGTEYEHVLDRLDSLFRLFEPFDYNRAYYTETAATVELPQFARRILSLLDTPEKIAPAAQSFFKDWYMPIDRDCFIAVMKAFDANVSDKPEFFSKALNHYGSVEAAAEDIFVNSPFADMDKVIAMTPADRERLASDPAVLFAQLFEDWYKAEVFPRYSELNSEITLCYRDYMRGRMAMGQDDDFFPDANLTLRVAYGAVKGYSPRDGVYYSPYSTIAGVVEKDDPDVFDYNIPQALRDMFAAGDAPDTPVCFLATNHTTGGNSGSPVINGDGNLVGINFDRVWEGTMSDIVFDPDYCRNISIDIRYLLFIVEKLGGATNILEEMTFVD